MGADPIRNAAASSRTALLFEALSAALGEHDADEVLRATGWSARRDGPRDARLAPLAWADRVLFDALLGFTSLERADGLRREARSILLSTEALPAAESLSPPTSGPTSGVRVTPAAARIPISALTLEDVEREERSSGIEAKRVTPSAPSPVDDTRSRATRRPPKRRSEAADPPRVHVPTGRSTVAPVQSGGIVLWTADEELADVLEARFANDDEMLFRVGDVGELRSALFVFTGRSPLVVLDRRGLEDEELAALRASELDGCSVLLWGTAHQSSPRLEGALSATRRAVSCAAEAGIAGVVELCTTLRRPSVSPGG